MILFFNYAIIAKLSWIRVCDLQFLLLKIYITQHACKVGLRRSYTISMYKYAFWTISMLQDTVLSLSTDYLFLPVFFSCTSVDAAIFFQYMFIQAYKTQEKLRTDCRHAMTTKRQKSTIRMQSCHFDNPEIIFFYGAMDGAASLWNAVSVLTFCRSCCLQFQAAKKT